jgi:hypothetical protein
MNVEGGYTSPVKVIAHRSPDAATAASVRKILCAWYGNLNAAADALRVDRRDLWRWSVGRKPVPPRVIVAMAARVDQAEADRKRVICSRVAKAQLRLITTWRGCRNCGASLKGC